MMYMYLNYLIVIFFLFSCNSKEDNLLEYYENGKKKSDCEMSNKKKNGKCIEYYENEKTKGISFWKNDVVDGIVEVFDTNGILQKKISYSQGKFYGPTEYYVNGKLQRIDNFVDGSNNWHTIEYFDNGKIKKEGSFLNGNAIGKFKYYNQDGKIIFIRDYELVKGEPVINQFFYFDSNGEIIKDKSNFISVLAKDDTISMGQECEFEIKLEASMMKDKMRVIMGSFDQEYNLLDSVNIDTLVGKNFKAMHKVKLNQPGWNFIRGIVEDYTRRETSNAFKDEIRQIFFTQKIWVKDKKERFL